LDDVRIGHVQLHHRIERLADARQQAIQRIRLREVARIAIQDETGPGFRPSGVPALTAARSRSPVEMCASLSSAFSRLAWVPLPDPGAPSNTMRIVSPSSARRPRKAG